MFSTHELINLDWIYWDQYREKHLKDERTPRHLVNSVEECTHQRSRSYKLTLFTTPRCQGIRCDISFRIEPFLYENFLFSLGFLSLKRWNNQSKNRSQLILNWNPVLLPARILPTRSRMKPVRFRAVARSSDSLHQQILNRLFSAPYENLI